MEHFRTRWAVLLISIFLLSSCGGSSSTGTTPLTPEGTVAVPIPIPPVNQNSATPNSGHHVGNTSTGSKSYYQATGLTNGNKYTITLYGLSGDADLWVYNDLPFDYIEGPTCKSQKGGTSTEQCVVTASGSTMNIEVDGEFALSGATYSISVNTPTAVASCTSGPGCFDFDTNPTLLTFPAPFVLTETGGVAPSPWNHDIFNVFGTANSIHSGGLNNSETSCFSYTTTTSTNSYVSFDLKVSSTQYYDLFLFYIDNVLQLPVWSGTVTSQKVMFNTTSGTHTYKWCHANNDTVTTGQVWVDNIFIQ